MKRSTFLVGLGMLVAFSCTKESENNMEASVPLNKTGLAPEAPYEVYQPQGEAYEALEAGLLENIGHEATATSCEVTKGIWLWESGLNYWFPSIEFEVENSFVSDYDEEIVDERVIQMSLTANEFDNQSLRLEFIRTYEDIESRVLDGLAHAVTDVQFVELQDDVITLRVKSIFYLNPSFSLHSAGPTVPSASYAKMVGYSQFCGVGATTGSWKDAQKRIKQVLPRPRYVRSYGVLANVFTYDTYPNSPFNRYLNGGYLPGRPNALYNKHRPISGAFGVPSLTCLIPSEQNAYAQAIADQLSSILSKRYYWDGVSSLRVDNNSITLAMECVWGYQATLATHFTYPVAHQKILPSSVI